MKGMNVRSEDLYRHIVTGKRNRLDWMSSCNDQTRQDKMMIIMMTMMVVMKEILILHSNAKMYLQNMIKTKILFNFE